MGVFDHKKQKAGGTFGARARGRQLNERDDEEEEEAEEGEGSGGATDLGGSGRSHRRRGQSLLLLRAAECKYN